MREQTSKGFTLVELMVVIAVVAILAAVAMPSYRELMDNYRVRKAGEDVVSLISNARSGAVKLHRDVNVSFGDTGGTDWCACAMAAEQPAAGALAEGAEAPTDPCALGVCLVDTEELAIPANSHPGVTMTGGDELDFNGVTGATTGLAGGEVEMTSPLGKFTATIVVTPLGQADLTISEVN